MDTTWTTLRILTALTAEGTSAPSTTVGIGQAGPRLEVRIAPGASVGGGPTSVTFGVWRGSGGRIDKLGTVTVAATDIAVAIPQLFEFNASACWITVESFVGGAGPTFTGSIDVRPVFGA